jgi:hypothetical protein
MQAIRVVYTKRVSLQTKIPGLNFSNLGAKEILEFGGRGKIADCGSRIEDLKA